MAGCPSRSSSPPAPARLPRHLAVWRRAGAEAAATAVEVKEEGNDAIVWVVPRIEELEERL